MTLGTARTLDVRNPRTGQFDYQIAPPSGSELAALSVRLRQGQSEWLQRGFAYRIAALEAWAAAIEAHADRMIEALVADTGRHLISHNEVLGGREEDPALVRRRSGPRRRRDGRVESRAGVAAAAAARALRAGRHHQPVELPDYVAADRRDSGVACGLRRDRQAERADAALHRADAGRDPVGAGAGRGVRHDSGRRRNRQRAARTGRCGMLHRQRCDRTQDRRRRCFAVHSGLSRTGRQGPGRRAGVGRSRPRRRCDPAPVGRQFGPGLPVDRRIYVDRSIHDRFVDRLCARAKTVRINYPDIRAGHLGPIMSARQAAIISDHLADAIAKGAQVRCGGAPPSWAAASGAMRRW